MSNNKRNGNIKNLEVDGILPKTDHILCIYVNLYLIGNFSYKIIGYSVEKYGL